MAASLVLGMSFGRPWHHNATSTEVRILRTRRSSENYACVTEQETREKMRRLFLDHTDIDILYTVHTNNKKGKISGLGNEEIEMLLESCHEESDMNFIIIQIV